MNEGQVLGMAGVFQAAEMVHALATGQGHSDIRMRTSLESVFRIDAPSPAAVFGGKERLRYGLESVVDNLGPGDRNEDVLRIAFTVLELARTFLRRSDQQMAVQEGLKQTQSALPEVDVTDARVIARLADLYLNTISNLKPKVMVRGDAALLQQTGTVERIRALLLAAIRSGVLWRQSGGGALGLIFRRGRLVQTAREMLGHRDDED